MQDAKARFSEVVRRAKSEGPQHVSVHGREGVVVVSAETFKLMTPRATGQALIDALQAIPGHDLDFDFESTRGPVRVVDL